MTETGQSYVETLQNVLLARKDFLERTELELFKKNLRLFQSSFASLYNIYLKKKVIDEDPYKQETKINQLEVPDSSIFQEAKRIEQLTIRLAAFDNQLDFLVNFYQLNTDFLNLDQIKRIVGLIRYIDWAALSPDSQNAMTKAVAVISNQAKQGVDPLTLRIIGESLTHMSKTTNALMKTIKDLSTYYREKYKLDIRQNITMGMAANEATIENIRKKMPAAFPGQPFYKELIEEIIKEDYAEGGGDLKDTILNNLRVKEEKPKNVKPPVDFKMILMDGIQVIGGSANTLSEIAAKLDDNQGVLESRKKSFVEVIKEFIRQLTNAPPEEVVYTLEYLDNAKGGVPIKEKLNFHQFRDELDKKIKVLSSFNRGSAYTKLAAMQEDQITGYLEKYIKDVQSLHRTLGALDDYLKANVDPADREKIKGIKPELTPLKNSFVKANQLRFEYSAQKEAEEQMKRLGINPANMPPETESGVSNNPPSGGDQAGQS